MSTFSGGMSWNVAFHGSQGSSRAPYRWSWRRSSVTKLRPWRSPQRCSASWSIGSIPYSRRSSRKARLGKGSYRIPSIFLWHCLLQNIVLFNQLRTKTRKLSDSCWSLASPGDTRTIIPGRRTCETTHQVRCRCHVRDAVIWLHPKGQPTSILQNVVPQVTGSLT